MSTLSRRAFLKTSALGVAGLGLGRGHALLPDYDIPYGERPHQASDVRTLNPAGRVPMSFIIDDSTCLVNMAYYGIPQFAAVFPDRYRQPWRTLPHEIPDSFVRSFGSWCRDHGVKGKYSIVPYPACVGWVDRFLPGWTGDELRASLRLVRDFMVPDWDIHPEMISHTRVIDTSTGRPYPDATPAFMENWDWSQDKSADELADYMSYALRILQNADLPCEGVTTPGGFAGRNQPNLARGTLEAVRHVYGTDVPHYFRNLYVDPDKSVAPRVYLASGIHGNDARCVVSIIGCTGDWFGGWDGLTPGSVDRFITPDLTSGRLVEVIDSDEPAILVCHWPGIYYNGEELGFEIFKEVVRRVHARYEHLTWMKLSDIARYWAARELTEIRREQDALHLWAPFAAKRFTLEVDGLRPETPSIRVGRESIPLRRVTSPLHLVAGTWYQNDGGATFCFDLGRGKSQLTI